MRRIFVVLCVFFSFTSVALAGDEVVLAKIGDKKFTLKDFERIISYYPEDKKKLIQQNPRYKPVLLKRFVQGMVLSEIAKKEGFDKDPAVKEQIDILVNDFLSVEYLRQKVAREVKVTEEDIEQYYKSHRDEFRVPERVRARHILIKVSGDASQTEKTEAMDRAKDILKRIKAGEDFETLARDFSEDTGSRDKGGDLGYFSRGRMVKPFEDVAFSLKTGEVSDIIETRFGYHIIKVEEKKPSEEQPLEEVKDKIREKLSEDFRQVKVKEFINSAMKDAGVEIYPEKLL